MANGKLSEGQRPFFVYAEECNPNTNRDYWHYKRRYFGGDDGAEFLDATELDQIISAASGGTHLQITMDGSSMTINVIRR